MSLAEMLILAVVQGVAEFLPISSSGHLVVVSELFGGTGASADVNIVLHAGTLLSILVYFRRRILRLLNEDRRVIWLLIVGTLPAGVLGLIVKSRFESVLENPLLAGFMLIVTGGLLLGLPYVERAARNYTELGTGGVLSIGMFQAFALLPGISRSGATIVGGLLAGLDRSSAATFSFLLAIPAIAGATVLELRSLSSGGEASASPALLGLGCAVAFAVGLGSLAWLFRWIERGTLHYFAAWCIPLGIAVVVWQLLG